MSLIAWGTAFCLVLFGALKWLKILRVDPSVEASGLDASRHGEPAYPADAWEEQQYWDHQVHRLVHLLGRGESPQWVSSTETEKRASNGLPPQMNLAHLVLTDHFQKCVIAIDRQQKNGWRPA